MSATADADSRSGHDHVRLARRIGDGDRVAEREFIALYQRGIRSLVRRHARPGEPAVDDFTQSVLQSLIEQLRKRSVADLNALPAYIRNTVVFTVRAEYRRRGHREEPLTEFQYESLADTETPEVCAQRDQLKGLVLGLLAELPVERDREILRLHYLAEEDRDSVCARLAIDASHFHRVLFRARERMRKLLQVAGFEDG